MKNRTGNNFSFISKILAHIVLGIMLWCSMGFVLWTAARKVCYEYMHNRKAGTEIQQLVISLQDGTNAALVWIEHDEIEYQGRMFDVKTKKIDGEKLILTGYYDGIDEDLFSLLREWFEDEGDEDADNTSVAPYKWIEEGLIVHPVYYNLVPGKFRRDFVLPSPDIWPSRPQEVPFNPPKA